MNYFNENVASLFFMLPICEIISRKKNAFSENAAVRTVERIFEEFSRRKVNIRQKYNDAEIIAIVFNEEFSKEI